MTIRRGRGREETHRLRGTLSLSLSRDDDECETGAFNIGISCGEV